MLYAFCYDLLVDAMLLKWSIKDVTALEGGRNLDVTTFQKKLQVEQMIFANFYGFLFFSSISR